MTDGTQDQRQEIERFVRGAISRRMAAEVDPVRSFDIRYRLSERDAAVKEAVDGILALMQASPSSDGGAEANEGEPITAEPEWQAEAFGFLYTLLGGEPDTAANVLRSNPEVRARLHRAIYERSPRDVPYDDMMARLCPDGLPQDSVLVFRGRFIPDTCPFPSVGRIGAPYAYNIDPGAGSGMDRLQRDWPDARQLDDLRRRDGSITPLFPSLRQMTT